jgi:hypothetical protein
MRLYTLLFIAALPLAVYTSAQSASDKPSTSPAQAGAPENAVPESLSVPVDTAFLAKLGTNLVLRECKPGDPVEAEAKQDVKQSKQVLLKKGSTLLGHVKAVQTPTAEKPETVVGIVFDGAKMQKTGQQFSLHLIVQALAPEGEVTNNDSLAEGRGIGGAMSTAKVSGHESTMKGNVNKLSVESKGIYDLSGIRLGDQVTGTGHITILASNGDFRLKKGTQLVMRVVNQ